MTCCPLSVAAAKRLYDQAASLAGIGGWECDLATQRLDWTDGVYDIFGLRRGSALSRSATVGLYEAESRREMERLRARAIAGGGGFAMDARIDGADGMKRWMRLTARVEFAQNRPLRIYGAKQDITHEKDMWTSLRELAYRDPLTGLANRRAFDGLCRDLHRADADNGVASALAIVDVDCFKQINDQLGHAAGDECLRQIGVRLGQAFDDALMIARIGGDEFAVLLRVPLGRSHLVLMLEHALRMLSCPVFWNGAPIDIAVSIGTAILRPPQNREPAQLFAEADSALYLAKTTGRNQVRIFGDAIDATGGSAAAFATAGTRLVRAS